MLTGDEYVADLITHQKKPALAQGGDHLTYDENGGWWDHAPQPRGEGWSDRWGPGTRIPAIIVSPYAKRGYVDKTPYDTTSIIKFITRRFGLEPLPGVRPKSGRPRQPRDTAHSPRSRRGGDDTGDKPFQPMRRRRGPTSRRHGD